jgi:hypothetical protein
MAGEDPAIFLSAAAEAAARTCGDYGAFGHGRPFAPVASATSASPAA